jgi:uncharacterized integral membrane protein (TIGR00697 family)
MMSKLRDSIPVYDASTEAGSSWRPKYLHIVGICLGAALIITNVFSFKLVILFGFTFGAGALLFPVCLILGDIITEVYGFKRARSVILTSLLCFFFYAVVSQVVITLPPAPQWKHQEAFAAIFSFAPRVFVAGALAYLIGEISNSFVMSRMKTHSGGQHFFARALLSTIVGELLNSAVFFTIVFWGKFEFSVIVSAIVNGTILKTAIEILVLPLTQAIVSKLKHAEGVEFFDKVVLRSPVVTVAT